MPCAIKTASTALDDAEASLRPARQPAANRANLTLVGPEQPRFIPDSTQTCPECVLGDEGPITNKNTRV
jgi:hypothetical protein